MTVTFPAGSVSQDVEVPTIDDDTPELLENFGASLSGPAPGLTLGADSTANVEITDNDGKTNSKVLFFDH